MNELPSLKETVATYGLLAKKSLGQNFLLDMNITGKIIRSSLAAQNKPDWRGEAGYEVEWMDDGVQIVLTGSEQPDAYYFLPFEQ